MEAYDSDEPYSNNHFDTRLPYGRSIITGMLECFSGSMKLSTEVILYAITIYR